MASRFYRVPLSELAFVRAIVEGYDGLAVLYSPDPRRGEIEWLVAEGREAEAEALALRLAPSGLTEIARPADWPEIG